MYSPNLLPTAGQRLERKTKLWSESYINYTTEQDVAIVVWEKPTKGSNLTGDCVSGFIYRKPQGALTDWKKIQQLSKELREKEVEITFMTIKPSCLLLTGQR